MCYRQAVVDFTGIHVACLSGENGAGKSALLDGITWALWGKARARRDDELIRLGQSEMEVDFTFQLGSDLYRVIRKRRAGKRGQSLLDFQVQDNGRWRSIAESTLRGTQAKIERVLRLDYETFVNSAFLRQGRADEFTVKTPAERKRVLGEILGLDIWAIYEERVKERLRAVQQEMNLLEIRLGEIEAELARRPEYEAQVHAAQAEVVELSAALQKAQEAWQAMEAARAELRHVRAQLDQVAAQVAQAQRERTALEQERAERQARLAEYEEVLAQAEEIEKGFAAYQEALERERALSEKLSALTELNERRNRLEKEIEEARHALETERARLAQRIQELQTRLVPPDLLQRHEALEAEIAALRQLQQRHEAIRDRLSQLAEEQAALQAENQALKPEMQALKERIDLLEQAAAACPLCGQPLSEDDRLRLIEELRGTGKQKGDTYRANRARLEEISVERAQLETEIAASEGKLRELPRLEREAATLAERIRSGEAAAQALEAVQAELERLDVAIAAEAYATEARQELEAVLAQAAELGYDREAHDAARAAIEQHRPFVERKSQLDLARAGVEQEREALARLEKAIRRWEEEERAALARQAELEKAAQALEERLREASAVEEELARVRAAEAEARRRLGAAQQRLAACDALQQQKARHLERREELAHQRGLYEELRTAFGVQGVPAMIIEAAVPEIETEANRLLSRMTNGRMHVRLETQRETKAGELRETLDIRIMDELGERPYENYSGGEQFRVNFALRIALSRLLARRAGAQLQTLIVDEGFGTQDAQGRERLVEAIHAIQDEFACLLIITHIEELQDAFPARIHVTKTPEGSVVTVI
jgi:exonuclease SbcC